MAPTIGQVIAAVPAWAGRSVVAERIQAGLTNTNYRVEVDGTPFFVRIPGAATELLVAPPCDDTGQIGQPKGTQANPRAQSRSSGGARHCPHPRDHAALGRGE